MFSVAVSATHSSALTRADAARIEVSSKLDPKERSKLGQFMTPVPVAGFIAEQFSQFPHQVRLLDAGAGVGALTAAFVHEACNRVVKPQSITVTAFEIDPVLLKHLKDTLNACTEECRTAGIDFTYQIISNDFILHAAKSLFSAIGPYTHAILNPPYGKINSASKARKALRTLNIEAPNQYAGFVAVAVQQLVPGGELVAITPRSFCNGTYFKPFRDLLLGQSALHGIHVYEARNKAFADDEVLQENIIYKLVKGEPQPATVWLSSSRGPEDTNISGRDVPFREVVLPSDPHRYIRLTVSDADEDLAKRVRGLPCMLKDLGVTVSTGRVVDFRAKEHLRKNPEAEAVPLIYPCHFEQGLIAWPKLDSRKHNALAFNMQTLDLMVPCGTYVLTKRFTSKEEKRRLVAVIYDPERIEAKHVGFENHLNYFHQNGGGLRPALARGLALFLNSTAIDLYFRQFSGHTQVNATDLRNLHYPTAAQLEEAGRHFAGVLPPQAEIDRIIEDLSM
ncbi:Eco57I restriction-modification methylase domain-containing protein [Azospirillum doebereinerae]|uniref:Eco57I restriction-modification methylase domain-containing protein n=1 Tax=Azospirillum doebereinerae TaxID=92933 RepID=UPI001EE4EF2D|nr:Eco57I restriction-modification methylase domain-containing protein [Azospirillum doebereinerae]MCG5244106.1 Eco57I restriction-modification methylase domain-containing protein [Azospirillum doebereinerae]